MIVRREDDPLLTNLASSPLPALCAYLVVLWSVLNVEFHTVNFYRHSIFGLCTSTWKFELTIKVWKKPQSYALGETESFYDSILKFRLETPKLSCNFMRFHHPILFLNFFFSFTDLELLYEYERFRTKKFCKWTSTHCL